MARILYITYDGVLEPLGQSQVLAYLTRLADSHDVTLLSYEKPGSWEDAASRSAVQEQIAQAGIRWVPLRYHQHPALLATAFDVLSGCVVGAWQVLRRGINIVHARSYVSSIPALLLKKLCGTSFVFDMRGFWADERAERAGCPKSSAVYRAAKWFERRFFQNADVVVSLTRAGVAAIKSLPYMSGGAAQFKVITTCTDLEAFRRREPQEGVFTLGYVGSTDTAYLFEPVIHCYQELRRAEPAARLLIVTRSDQQRLRMLLEENGIAPDRYEVKRALHSSVAREMSRMSAGIFFVKAGFSACASMPTKLGEFLACGVPCLCNAGIGDVPLLLAEQRTGVILEDYTRKGMATACEELLALARDPEVRGRCRKVAQEHFSLESGVKAYDAIYRQLTCKEDNDL